jgi:hypothetical protein
MKDEERWPLRNIIPFIPAVLLLWVGLMFLSLTTLLTGVTLFVILYELYKIKIKLENSEPWY